MGTSNSDYTQDFAFFVGGKILNDESLKTLLCEVEAIINWKTYNEVSRDSNDLEALTPNHFLFLKSQYYLLGYAGKKKSMKHVSGTNPILG